MGGGGGGYGRAKSAWRYDMAERISTLIVAICLCEAWCWANAFPTMTESTVGEHRASGEPRASGDRPMQLSLLARHYERSTSIFKGGAGDTLPAREQSLSRAVQEGASATSAGRPHTDTIVAQHVAMASARPQLQSGRPTGSATLWHSSAIGLGRTAHRNERQRQFSETGKKSIPRGITEVLPALSLLFRLMPSGGNAASSCCHGNPTAAFILLQMLLVGLQVPGSQAASAGAAFSAVDTDWSSLAAELLSSQPLALGALAVLVSLYCVYSMSAARHYPPRMHVLWPALQGKFKLDEYGPVECLRQAQRKHGEIFRICLPGQSCTFLIGREACECWFKQQNDTFNPAAAYRSFMKPVFGPRVVYDAEEGKMSSQLRFVKHGLGIEMMRQHPAKLVREVRDYCVAEQSGWLRGEVELYHMTSEMIINTASRCILGDEIRDTVHKEFSQYYSDLEKGISHLSFFAPWLPTPAHRRRDVARRKLSEIFTPIIRARRDSSAGLKDEEKKSDFLQVLIDGEYRDGTKPDDEAVVGLLVAALFGGQHTSNITSTWLLMMIHSPENRTALLPRLLKEQEEVLSRHNGEITFDALQEMDLLENCIKETLRIFPPLIVSLERRRSLARHIAWFHNGWSHALMHARRL